MRRRALLRRLAGLSTLAAVPTASAHPGGRGSRGTDTGPSGSGPGPHAKLPMGEAREAVVGPSGTTVYVATMDGFATVDVADPHDPTILATVEGILADHEDGPLAGIQDVKVDGDRLLVVGPAHPSDGLSAAVVFDVADPATPRRVGVHVVEYYLHNCYLRDGIAYLPANGAPGNPLVTVDVSDEPTELGRWSIADHDDTWLDVPPSLRVLHDVWVTDDLAYLAHWDAGTWILDVSDPATPSFVARVRGRDPDDLPTEPAYAVRRESVVPPGNDHFVTTDEDGQLLGIGTESWAFQGSGGPSGITLYDVSEPTEPVERGHIDHPPTENPSRDGVWTTAHNFELVDGYCYSAWYQGGVQIHDVSEPADPVEAYRWRESDAARFWTAGLAVPGQSFVASSMGVPDGTGEGTPTGTEGDDEGSPGLYVFPDVVHAAPDATPTGEPIDEGDPSSASGPGFGVGATVAGALGLGAWWARRDESTD